MQVRIPAFHPMTTLVKSNYVTLRQLWRTFGLVNLRNRRDTELLDMTRSRSFSSHSYTSLRDVVDSASLPAPSRQWNNHLNSFQSLPDVRHVHMKNPLLEKAAKVYLATAKSTAYEHQSSMRASPFSFIKMFRIPFQTTLHTLFGGVSAWLRQLYIKN